MTQPIVPTAQPTRIPSLPTPLPARVPEPGAAPIIVDPFAVPELFPGFQELFASEEQREREIEDRIVQLTAEDSGLISKQVEDAEATGGAIAIGGLESLLAQKLAKRGDIESRRIRRQEIQQELTGLATRRQRSVWRMGIISLLQRDILEDQRSFVTVGDLVASMPISLSEEDREFAQLIIDSLNQPDVEELRVSETDRKALQRLQQPGTNLARLFAMNPAGKTAEELVAVVAAAHRFQLPQGMSVEDQRDLFRRHEASDEDIARFEDENRAEMDLIIQTIRDDTARMEAFKTELSALSSGELNSSIRHSLMLQGIARPGLVAMIPFEFYARYVGRPFAGFALTVLDTPHILGVPFTTVLNDSFYDGFSRAKRDGVNEWMAHSYAFNNWDTNGFLKFGAEVILDPINVLGFTWFTKIVKPLPLIGKPLAAFNQGYMRIAEIPFDVAGDVLKLIPKPLSTRATQASMVGFDDFKTGLYNIYRKPLREVEPDEIRLAFRPAIEMAQKNPTSPDPMVTIGQWILPSRIINVDDVKSLSIKLGKEININPEILGNANAVMELTDGFGITKFSLPSQSADALLRVFDVVDDAVNSRHAIMSKWLTDIKVDMNRIANKRLEGDSTKQILSNLMTGISDDYRAATTGTIANQRYQQGLIAGGLDILTWAQRVLVTGGVERYFTMPFARAYLLFGFYGVGNLLETTLIKTGLGAGLNPFWRGNPHVDAGILFANYRGVPDTILTSGEFVLSLGDEASLKRLGDFGRTGSGNINNILKDTRPAIEKFIAPRWVKSWTGFNWAARASNAALANYWNRFFMRLVSERHPLALKAVDDMVLHLLPSGGRLDELTTPKIARQFRNLVRKRLISGDIQLTKSGIKDVIDLNAIKSSELEKLLVGSQEIIPDIRDLIMRRGLNGELWTMGTSGIERFFEDILEPALLEKYFSSPQFFLDNLTVLADDLNAFIPTTVDDLNIKTTMLGDMVDMYGDVVNVSLESAGLYSRKISNPAIRDDFWNAWWDTKIDPILNPIADKIDEMARILREQLTTDSPIRAELEANGKLVHYLSFMDSMSKSGAAIKVVRETQSNIRFEYFNVLGSKFKRVGRDRDAQFWDSFNDEITEMWKVANTNRFSFMEEAYSAAARSEFIKFPAPVDISKITMKPEHIAQLFGVSSQELTKFMYIPELMAIRGKQSFTTRMLGQAERAAAQHNTTAEQLGYTKVRLDELYEKIMSPIRATVQTEGHSFDNSRLELLSIRNEIIKLTQRQNAIASDDLVEYLQKQLYGSSVSVSTPVPETQLQGGLDEFIPDETVRQEIRGRLESVFTQAKDDLDRGLVRVREFEGKTDDEIMEVLKTRIGDPDAPDLLTINPEITRQLKDRLATEGKKVKVDSEYVEKLNAGIVNTLRDHSILQNRRAQLIDDLNETDLELWLTATGTDVRNSIRGGLNQLLEANTVDDMYFALNNLSDITITIDNRVGRGRVELLLDNYAEIASDYLEQFVFDDLGGAVTSWFSNVNNDDLMAIGRMAEGSSSYRASIQSIVSERFPSGFVRVFRGRGAANGRALERDYTNVTSSRQTAQDFQAVRGEDIAPDIDGVLIRVDDILSIGSVDESEIILRSDVMLDRLNNPLPTPQVIGTTAVESELDRVIAGAVPPTINREGLDQLLNPEWPNTIQDTIIPEIQRNFRQDFPIYNDANVVAAAIKPFIPFWHYEAHRFPWLLREGLRHPGTIATLGKYRNNTDEGYIPIPKTPLDINPLRGNIFMGGMRRLFQRDYPEFYDELEGVSEKLDYISRWGFYPGAPLAIPLAVFGAKRNMQIGALVPQWQRSIFDVAEALFPDSAVIKRLRNTLFNDAFKDYITANAAARQGHNGPDLLRKRVKGESFTPEEEQEWSGARREIAIYGPIMEQTGLFRYSPEEKRAARRLAAEAAAEIIGTDPDDMAAIFEDLRKNGLLFEDVFGALPPEVNDVMKTLEGFHHWTGFGIALGPSELGEQKAIIQEFFGKITDHSERQQNTLLQVEADMRAGVRDMNDWLRANRENRRSTRDFIATLQTQDRYKDIPMDLQGRIDWAVERNTLVPIFSGIEELQQFYFKIELKEAFNFDTGNIEFDWDTFYNEQDAVRLGMPNDIEERFDARIARNDTPLQRKHRELNRDLFRLYFNTTFDIVLANNNPEEQSQIRRFKATANPLERQELRQIVSGENRLISTFNSELRNIRQNIRDVDPELDAWLVFFNPRMTPRTQASTDRFLAIKKEFGVP